MSDLYESGEGTRHKGGKSHNWRGIKRKWREEMIDQLTDALVREGASFTAHGGIRQEGGGDAVEEEIGAYYMQVRLESGAILLIVRKGSHGGRRAQPPQVVKIANKDRLVMRQDGTPVFVVEIVGMRDPYFRLDDEPTRLDDLVKTVTSARKKLQW